MERTEIKTNSSKWKNLFSKVAFLVVLFVAGFAIESVQAQGGFGEANLVPFALSPRANNNQGVNFIPASEVDQTLSVQIALLESNSPLYNGGATEATASIKAAFYQDIINTVAKGDTVADSVLDAYGRMLHNATSRHGGATVNTDAILQDAIDLLSI